MAVLGHGFLQAGQHHDFAYVFTANTPYRLSLRSQDTTVDFDLAVYDENHTLVELDEADRADATCIVTPRWTGTFWIRVVCQRGSASYTLYSEP